MTSYSGVIFDCDGVLVDSEPWSCGAWNIVLEREYGIDIGTDYSPILGKSTKDALDHYFGLFHLPKSQGIYKKLAREKEQVYLESAAGNLKAMPGIEKFIQFLITKGISMAVASSGIPTKIQFNLAQSGLNKYFRHIVSADDVKRGKPAPDIFLAAADSIAVPIQRCVVIEDSIMGVLAGTRSGAFTVAFTSSFSIQELAEAALIIDDFGDPRLFSLFN